VPSRLCKPLGVYFHIYIQLNSEDDRFAPNNTLNRHLHMTNVLLWSEGQQCPMQAVQQHLPVCT